FFAWVGRLAGGRLFACRCGRWPGRGALRAGVADASSLGSTGSLVSEVVPGLARCGRCPGFGARVLPSSPAGAAVRPSWGWYLLMYSCCAIVQVLLVNQYSSTPSGKNRPDPRVPSGI